MSGISTTGDVKLDGDPNAFTGTNTFDVNRPTSSLGGTPNTTDFITKQDGDTLYQGTGNVALLNGNNAFTGTTNTFDNRPAVPSTPAAPSGLLDFITRRDGNSLYVTTDTIQDITGEKKFKDNVELDGALNSNVALLTQDGLSGNSFLQKAPLVGNLIVQGVSPSTQPSTPVGASLFFQAGTTSLIQTDGKVVCGTAPTAGEDLTNKTYVDTAIAAAGGGLEYFMGYDLNPNTPTAGFNMRFSNGASSSGVTFNKDTGSGSSQGAKFTASPTSAGNWLIGFTGANLAGASGYGFLVISSSRVGSIGQYFDYRPTTNQFNNANIIVATEVQSGDVITCMPLNTFVGNQGGNFTSFWGIKLG